MMVKLLEGLTKILDIGGIAPREAAALQTIVTRSSRWDEALPASLYDETARKYLDYLGPRL